MENRYDVIIVGAGPAGIFSALELVNKREDLKILLVDKGKLIQDRNCPIVNKQSNKCLNCSSCSIISGFGGAGTASDGKLTAGKGYGGRLEEYIGDEYFNQLLDEVVNTYIQFGADDKYYEPNQDLANEVIRNGAKVGLKVIPAKVRHMGTDASRIILNNIYDYLKDKITILMNSTVTTFLTYDENTIQGIVVNDKDYYFSSNIILAPERDGATWLDTVIKSFNIPIISMPVDIGVRVEVSNDICQYLTDQFYELKVLYNTPTYDDRCRTFCMNPSGYIVTEYNKSQDIVTVNGHSLKNQKSNNTNFSILVTKNFTEPFNDPINYATHISRLANMLAGGNILIQRLGNLKNGRRSTHSRIERGMVQPTFNAEPGDLSLVLPHRYVTDILEFLDALNEIIPGINHSDTLLYGIEIKLYSLRPQLNNDLSVPNFTNNNLYMIGDASNVSRGILQASASGIVAARSIIERMN